MKRLIAFSTAVLAVVLLAFAVVGCSTITSGTVTEKEYEESYTWFMQQCSSYNTKGVCTGYIMVPISEPECWELDLDNGEDTGELCVSEEEFNRYRVGDQYP